MSRIRVVVSGTLLLARENIKSEKPIANYKRLNSNFMGEIIKALRNPSETQHKGNLLESVLVELLKDLGFSNVERQQSGTQFGFDVIAYKISQTDCCREVWKFECKNLADKVTSNDIAPKLIWHSDQSTIDYFVIVSTSNVSNDLRFLLENHSFPMGISLWTGDELEKLIAQSPRALKRLGFDSDIVISDNQHNIDQIEIYPPKFFTLDVVHQLNPPFSFDYIKIGDEILKAYTEHEFRLLVSVINLTKKPLIIKSLDVVTLRHEKVTGRAIRLHKAKGIFEPPEFAFELSRTPGVKDNILGKNIWEIGSGTAGIISLILSDKITPGLYEIIFSVDALIDGIQTTRLSPRFIINIRDDDTDLIVLQINNRHHETPIPVLLDLNDKDWNKIKAYKRKKNTFTFLGPTMHEMIFGYQDPTWTVRSCSVQPQGDGLTYAIDSYKPSELVVDLGIAVDEELICGPEAVLKHILKRKKQEDVVPTQLKRKAIYRDLE